MMSERLLTCQSCWCVHAEGDPCVVSQNGWRPIETAPKDGTWILLYPGHWRARWDFGDEGWLNQNIPLNARGEIDFGNKKPEMWFCQYCDDPEPTHWMPLPNPPVMP